MPLREATLMIYPHLFRSKSDSTEKQRPTYFGIHSSTFGKPATRVLKSVLPWRRRLYQIVGPKQKHHNQRILIVLIISGSNSHLNETIGKVELDGCVIGYPNLERN